MSGGTDSLSPVLEDDGEHFFYSKRYEHQSSRFEDLVDDNIDPAIRYTPCTACRLVV